MAELLAGLVSGVGTVAKGVGAAASGLGKGFLSGAGQAAGLGEILKPATMAMKNPLTGVISQIAAPATTSVWSKVGATLGKGAVSGMGGGVSTPSSLSLPSPSTEVSQSRGYQPPQKKQAELERLLRELARR